MKKHKINKLDIFLFVLFAIVFLFTVVMIVIFTVYQAVPDTLIVSVFGLACGECGCMSWIKQAKEKNKNKDEETDKYEEANG